MARDGDAAPGLGSGIEFTMFQNHELRLNNNGRIAIKAYLSGTSNFGSVWAESSTGSLGLVAQDGEIAPGTDMPWTGSSFSEVAFNDNGQVAFSGRVTLNPDFLGGVWRGSPGEVSPVIVPNEPAPGTTSQFRSGNSPQINNSGQVAFVGALVGTSQGRDSGLWSEGRGNGLELIAREGDQAAGSTADVLYRFIQNPLINDAGDVAFFSTLSGAGVDSESDTGIWRSLASGETQQLAIEGGQAVGTDVGVFYTIATGLSLHLNGQGRIAFASGLRGAGVTADNAAGLWAEDSKGELQLIARSGDLLEVVDEDGNVSFRTISTLSFASRVLNSGNGASKPSSFNDLGQIVFEASFTDGSNGVFVSNLVAVPEPSALCLLSLFGLSFFCRKRQAY